MREGEATPRVLVVDDDRMTQMLLRRNLTQAGYEVESAGGGEEALAKVRATPFDLVILDFMMPGMDGNEAIERIRKMPEYAHLPVVFLTAQAMPGDRERSLTAGASEYVTKPVDLDRLLTVMRSWLPASDGT